MIRCLNNPRAFGVIFVCQLTSEALLVQLNVVNRCMESKHPEQLTDLFSRIQNGDKAAFALLYDQYAGALFGVVSKIVRSEEAAQDVLQDSFVKIWKHAASYQPEKGSCFTWMLNIARNTAIDHLRKEKRAHSSEIQTLDSGVDIPAADQTLNVQTIGVKDLVHQLPVEQRLMVEYIYYGGYTQQEVADELGIPLGTVKTRVRTAVNALRKYFNLLLIWI